MNIIECNPYRVLGLLAGSSDRELHKQIAIIKRFAEVGKRKDFDCDFLFIGNLSRSTEDVSKASSKIEQSHNKTQYALFWFVNASVFDDIAINQLKEANTGKAIEVWSKALRTEISSKNYTAYQNISTLYIATSLADDRVDMNMMQMGVELKGRLLESEFLSSFVELIGGGLSIDREAIGKTFVDDIVSTVERLLVGSERTRRRMIVELFEGYPIALRKYLLDKFTEEPLLSIEKEIEVTTEKRRANPEEANQHGKLLQKITQNDVDFLSSLFETGNVQLQIIRDKLAQELLQCAIDYYNKWIDDEDNDPGIEALKVANYAKKLNPTARVKDRLDKSIQVFERWVKNKPQRDEEKKVSSQIATVTGFIDNYDKSKVSITLIERFIVACKSELNKIKSTVGADDEYYLQVCDVVVNRALSGLIGIHNQGQEDVVSGRTDAKSFKTIVESTIAALDKLKLIGMTSEVRARLNENRKSIDGVKVYIEKATQESSGGCYIATMVYGDYDHPQVLALRAYRDRVLDNNVAGRTFIRAYYFVSPQLVIALKRRRMANRIIRVVLDKWIERIGK